MVKVTFSAFCLVLIFTTIACTAMIDKMRRITNECKEEIGIRGDKLEGREEKCFYACVERKYGNIVNGEIVTDNIVQQLEMPKKMNKAVKLALIKCLHEANESTDECELYNSLIQCTRKTS